MTSTSFNVGLTDNTRSSSRVLRPPGGGHTDLFGESAEVPQPQPPTRRGPPPSSIGAVVAPEAPKSNGQARESPRQNGQNGQSSPQEPIPAEIPAPEVKQNSPAKPEPVIQPAKAEPPKRVRVPPGGFSSGLW